MSGTESDDTLASLFRRHPLKTIKGVGAGVVYIVLGLVEPLFRRRRG